MPKLWKPLDQEKHARQEKALAADSRTEHQWLAQKTLLKKVMNDHG
jgi:hypothetical protein